jgi:type II secretory ATPase GspE/PulE/Tfp pilus assembly ATPase PilB-like protein
MALIVLLLAAGTTAAQAPDVEAGRGRPNQERDRGPRGLLGLLAPADAEVEVTPVDHGVELTLTAKGPDEAAELQEQVEAAADNVRRMAERLARWRERRPNAPLPSGLPGMLVDGEVDLSVLRVEGGSLVQLLAEDEQLAEQMQQNITEWVEQARQRRERLASRFRQAAVIAELRRLVDEGAVQIAFEPTDEGINVQFRTDDPQLARKLQRVLPAYFESLTHPEHETPRPVRRNRDREPAED